MPFHQVDISEKPVVYREAVATGRIRLKKTTVDKVRKGKLEKGDAVSLAAVAAIAGAKKTSDLVTLCHPLRIEHVEPTVEVGDGWVDVTVKVAAHEKTGVEMEALTAVAAALLNIWDVTKAYEKDPEGRYPWTAIESIRVVRKLKRAE